MKLFGSISLVLALTAASAYPAVAATSLTFSVPININSPVPLSQTGYSSGRVECSVTSGTLASLASGHADFPLANPPATVSVMVNYTGTLTLGSYECDLYILDGSRLLVLPKVFTVDGTPGAKFLSTNNLKLSTYKSIAKGSLVRP